MTFLLWRCFLFSSPLQPCRGTLLNSKSLRLGAAIYFFTPLLLSGLEYKLEALGLTDFIFECGGAFSLGEPSKLVFRKKLGIWPNKGEGGLTEAQVFVEIFQNQICLGKWPEMWWNTQYINGGAVSNQFMRVLDPQFPIPQLSQPKTWKLCLE